MGIQQTSPLFVVRTSVNALSSNSRNSLVLLPLTVDSPLVLSPIILKPDSVNQELLSSQIQPSIINQLEKLLTLTSQSSLCATLYSLEIRRCSCPMQQPCLTLN